MTAPTPVDRLRQAIADTLSIDAQGLQAAIGQLVVATSADYPAAGPEDRSLYSAAVRTTVLLADRIPEGQEAQALAQEIERHHGRQAAQAVIGERVAELCLRAQQGGVSKSIGGEPRKLFQYDGGAAGTEFFFLEETPSKLAAMVEGNAVAAEERDLSMRPKEYWETRPSPAKLHHWTAEEFAAHLEHHNYPGGTIEDRMRGHVLAIRKALTQGQFVPAVVMATEEGRSALEDAIMEVRSLDEGAFRTAQQNRARAQFAAILIPATIESLVIGGVKQAAEAKGAEPQPMVIDGYPRPVWCAVVDDRVVVKDTGWGYASLYGQIHEIEWGAAESIVRKAVLGGALSYDDSLWFMGTDWQPFAVVHDCSPSP